MNIGLRLKGLIEEKGITAYILSEDTAIPQSTISRIINKGSKPNASNLKVLCEYFLITRQWFLTGSDTTKNKSYLLNENSTENSVNEEPTGYFHPDVSVAAGMDKEMNNDELQKIPINLPNWEKGIDFINVYGDSMYPKFCSGEIIGIKEVELQYINFGYAYVVILKDGQVLLKFIKKGVDKDFINLESENKFYEPKEYHLNQIKKVFIIKGVITKTTM